MTSTDWDEDLGRWMVSTNRQDRIKARYVVHSNGPLNRPKLPAIRGINDFTGHTFHTSRWDYSYTGGDARGCPAWRTSGSDYWYRRYCRTVCLTLALLRNNFMCFSVRRRPSTSEITKRQTLTG